MKLATLLRFSEDDYTGAPDWFRTFLGSLNQMVDSIGPLVQHNIDLDNNILGERQTLTVTNGVPITVRLRTLKTTPSFVRVGYAAGYVGVAAITKYNVDGTLQVTVNFTGTQPTSSVSITVYFEP